MKQTFDVTGMTCSACSAHVEKSVKALKGVERVSVNLLRNNMVVEYDGKQLGPQSIISAVRMGGYDAAVHGEKAAEQPAENPADEAFRQMRRRLILSIAFLIPLMYVSMGHMLGAPLPGFLTGPAHGVSFAMVQFLLTIPILLINRHYFTNGFKQLFRLHPNMDSLIAVGSAAAAAYSVYTIFVIGEALGRGDLEAAGSAIHSLYFESSAMILTLITLGKMLESRAKRRTSDAISALIRLSPKTAVVLRGGVETEIPAEQVVAGDTVIVRAGQTIPVDGGFNAYSGV